MNHFLDLNRLDKNVFHHLSFLFRDNKKCLDFDINESKSFDDRGNLQHFSHVSIDSFVIFNQFQQRTRKRKLPDESLGMF